MPFTLPEGLGTAKDILKRFKKAQERRDLWRSIIKDMYDFCIPNRETFDFHSPGERKSRHIFDSTAPQAVNSFVSIMIGSMTPDSSKWMEYQAGSDIPEEEKKRTNELLEKSTETFFKYLSLSDFQNQIFMSHQDMALSTGCLIVEEGSESEGEPLLKISAIPMPELYLEPTSLPFVHTFFRKFQIKAQEILIKYPDAKLTDKQRKKIEKNPTTDVKIIDGSQVFNFKDKTYHQIAIWDDEVIFHQSYGESRPGIVYGWSKVANETYRRGPVDMLMSDIRTVNKVKEFVLKQAALTLSPPLLASTDGVFNPHTARIHPGAIIPVLSTANAPIIPLESNARLDVGAFVIEDLQASIRKGLLSEPLGDISDPVRSATENLIRQQETVKSRGANFGRLKGELINPFVNRVTHILSKNGKIAEFKVDGRNVSLKMSSPLAAAEERENIDSLFVYLDIISRLPEDVALLGAPLEAVPGFAQKNLSLPEELSRSKEDIEAAKKILTERLQQQGQENVG